jgi:hypothetical protein
MSHGTVLGGYPYTNSLQASPRHSEFAPKSSLSSFFLAQPRNICLQEITGHKTIYQGNIKTKIFFGLACESRETGISLGGHPLTFSSALYSPPCGMMETFQTSRMMYIKVSHCISALAALRFTPSRDHAAIDRQDEPSRTL